MRLPLSLKSIWFCVWEDFFCELRLNQINTLDHLHNNSRVCLKKVSPDLRSVEPPSRGRCWRKKERLRRRLLPARTLSSTWLTSYQQSLPHWGATATFTTLWRKVSIHLLQYPPASAFSFLTHEGIVALRCTQLRNDWCKSLIWFQYECFFMFVVLISRCRD